MHTIKIQTYPDGYVARCVLWSEVDADAHGSLTSWQLLAAEATPVTQEKRLYSSLTAIPEDSKLQKQLQ